MAATDYVPGTSPANPTIVSHGVLTAPFDPYPQYALDTDLVSFHNSPILAVGGTPQSATSSLLREWALAQAFRLNSATRDANGAITTATVTWPDGIGGTFTTDTASSSFPGAIDAYHVTYLGSGGGGTDLTVTQTAVTRDPSTGAVTAQPALTVA